MELAVRDNRPVSEGDIQAANSIFISWGIVAAIICLIAIPAAYFVPWYVGPSLAGAASLFSMIAVITSGRITRWTILTRWQCPSDSSLGFTSSPYCS
ncbi:MAG: hypothetical protein A49_17960 [Methyloceanibacter sp.]|nr:MAG: hypothetical protein A49_17960 [Methyloceanibacter sp.]